MDVQLADFVTVGLLVGLEGLLSADNALVIAVMILGLPSRQRGKALSYGLVGAFAFRVVATLLAIYLIRLVWMKLVGGLYLMYLCYDHFAGWPRAGDRRGAPAVGTRPGASVFWGTVVRVELVNLAFSIDSILVAVAVSPKLWVVLTGGILGLAAMRLVVSQLIALIERYPALVDGAYVIVAWVATKLAIEYLHAEGLIAFDIPRWISLTVIMAIFVVAFIYARTHARRSLSTHDTPQEILDR